MRVVDTEIRNEDVIGGTESRILETFENYQSMYHPQFILLSAGPCSAMIGTDLELAAEKIQQRSGIRTAAVKLSGQKNYDTGISETLTAMAKLLPKKESVKSSGVNILGATGLDWQEENIGRIRGWLKENGVEVTADFGGREYASNLEKAVTASMNLVLTVSGIAAAKYMEKEYGIPYLIGAPFGKNHAEKLLARIKNEAEIEKTEESKIQNRETTREENVLIIGEQVMANAIRETLREEYGYTRIQVCTFYLLEKSIAKQGDCRIRNEEAAEELLKNGEYQIVIADPLLRKLANPDCIWLDLPHKAFELYGEVQKLPLILDENLNKWLEAQWEKTGERRHL